MRILNNPHFPLPLWYTTVMARRDTAKKKKKSGRKALLIILCVLLALGLGAYAVLQHMLAEDQKLMEEKLATLPETPNDGLPYEVRGVDVSIYQGDMDWKKLREEGYTFAFIKATEGSNHVDDAFAVNWEEAEEAGVYTGAYHFLSLDSDPVKQAENFISHVPAHEDMLPPVIDVELYGKYLDHPPTIEQVDAQLEPLLTALKDEYGLAPIIYTSSDMYLQYFAGKYYNAFWISDPTFPKELPDGRLWTFLQYDLNGDSEAIDDAYMRALDLDVYYGTKEEFVEQFLMPDNYVRKIKPYLNRSAH